MSKASMRRRWQNVDGVLLLDKPSGISSNDALQRARRVFQAAKAGHTGTLDPLATGLLPVLFGEATKFSHQLLDADKTYLACLQLGVSTTTGDAEGDVIAQQDVSIDEAIIHSACSRFVGELQQLPPMYSALKHEGRALYEYARQGVEIERTPRKVTIHMLQVLSVVGATVQIRVRCSKGTYVRTLAEDIGKALGVGAHLTSLRRTATGPLTLENAVSLSLLQELNEDQRVQLLLPPDSLLAHLPKLDLDDAAAARFLHGQAVACSDAQTLGQVRVYGSRFLGLAVVETLGVVTPSRLIAQSDPS